MNDIGVPISKASISICHRLGRAQRNSPRPTIVRFVRRVDKIAIMKAKKKLKEIPKWSKLFINDDLTKLRSLVVRELKLDPNVSKVWTTDGKINCIIQSDGNREEKVTIDNCYDVNRFGWMEERVKTLGLYLDL